MTPWRLLKPLLVVAIIVGGGYMLWRQAPKGRVGRQILATVTRGDLVVKVTISGAVMPRRYANIAAPYNGYVQKLYVKVGDRVAMGAPIVSVAQAIGGGQEEVFPLRSPLAGVVAQVWKREGEYVAQGTGAAQGESALVRIDDVTKLSVECNVPEVEISKLKVGLPVLIRVVAVTGRTYSGAVNEIALAAREQVGGDRGRVEFPLSIVFNDQDSEIRPGMSAVADIIVNEAKNTLMLPHEFVQSGPKGYFVTLASGERRPIEVGLSNEDAFEIKNGLNQGDQIRQVDFLAIGGES